jgi:peptide deformylase
MQNIYLCNKINIMTILEILQYPDPRLRLKAKPVNDVHEARIQQIVDDMLETLYNTSHCAGLSATQLNIKDPPRITVIDESANNKQSICLINPSIVQYEGESEYSEGCMSVYPDSIHANVVRPDKITFKALDRNGQLLEIAAEGFFARCVQHEIDHLDGILYIDRLSALKRKILDKKISKLRKSL